MKNFKLVASKITMEKRGIPIIETKIVPLYGICKQCKKNTREPGSSRCADCSMSYKTHLHAKKRLQKRVDEASKKNY